MEESRGFGFSIRQQGGHISRKVLGYSNRVDTLSRARWEAIEHLNRVERKEFLISFLEFKSGTSRGLLRGFLVQTFDQKSQSWKRIFVSSKPTLERSAITQSWWSRDCDLRKVKNGTRSA